MSLINEALKKAQHQRTGGPSDAPPMPGGGSGRGRGNHGMPKGTLMLLIAGAFVVIVVSVVATVYFVNRPAATKLAAEPVAIDLPPVTVPAASTAPTTAAAPVTAPSPVIIAPVIIPAPLPVVALAAPSDSSSPSTQPKDASRRSSQSEGGPTTVMPDVTPAITSTPASEPVVEGSLSDRINDYLDKLHVTGVRMSETGVSKVLMNDRVYRANDLVNRKLGLKLTKIAADSLTFEDAEGLAYVKTL